MGLFKPSTQDLMLAELTAIRFGIELLVKGLTRLDDIDLMKLAKMSDPTNLNFDPHPPYEPLDLIITNPQQQMIDEALRDAGDDSPMMLEMLRELAKKEPEKYGQMWELMEELTTSTTSAKEQN